ncbi:MULTISPECIES: class I ribonucleotide reductase maintenance protein YfaE [Thalassotalea]|uniref:class I ribonucleotide reductase maintenance protein YfaE n=1 Tax=Thalassotalea TaxID=1518149 RepID=UPI000A894B04|nr:MULTISPECIES: class I ribonucleotide reductase maintenance protein YfaE [Thalassotalea]
MANCPTFNMSKPPAKIVTANQQNIEYQDQDKTLLNCLEKHDVEVHYHCRDGFCGACRVTLKKGQVLYPQGEPLAFVGDNEILPCCCIPASNIEIEID